MADRSRMAERKKSAGKGSAKKPKRPVEEQAQPHKLEGRLVLLKFNAKRQLVAMNVLEETLFRPNFGKASKAWQGKAKEVGEGFVASWFEGHLFGAKLNEHREVIDEGPMGPITLLQADFSRAKQLIESAVEQARAEVDPTP